MSGNEELIKIRRIDNLINDKSVNTGYYEENDVPEGKTIQTMSSKQD